jgi:F-type H+-transporting ATPase subunit epsilon
MTAGTMFLKIITPERIVLEAPVKKVTARAVDGELTILPDHEPIVTALAIDIVEFQGESSFDTAAVIGGVMEVKKGEDALKERSAREKETKEKELDNIIPDATYVTIVSNMAELDTEIDEARAKQAKDRLEAEKTQKTDKLEVQVAEMALSRAMARLKAVELTKRRKGGHNR